MCHHYRANKVLQMLAANPDINLEWLDQFSIRTNQYQLPRRGPLPI
jgi:hypothetical protein